MNWGLNNFSEGFLNGNQPSLNGGLETALLVLLLSFALGHVIAWVYVWTHTGLSYSQSFTASLVILPVIVSLIMLLMQNNIVTALGLLAVFAVVRFRNVLKDTRDTTFILWAIVQGMAVGTMLFSTAVTGAVCIALVYLYLRLCSFGTRHRFEITRRIDPLLVQGHSRVLEVSHDHHQRVTEMDLRQVFTILLFALFAAAADAGEVGYVDSGVGSFFRFVLFDQVVNSRVRHQGGVHMFLVGQRRIGSLACQGGEQGALAGLRRTYDSNSHALVSCAGHLLC